MSIYEYLTEEVVEESVDSILENCIVDGVINEEYIQEITFTKKQLQDPKTLKKLLERAQKEKNVKMKLDLVFLCLTVVEAIAVGCFAGSITIGIMAFVGFIYGTFKLIGALDKVLYATQEKRIETLEKKCKRLRDKMAKYDNPEAKKIVAKCNEVLKTIEDYRKQIEEEKFKERVNMIKRVYKGLVDIINSEDIMDEPDINYFALAKIVNIPYSDIDKGMKASAKKDKETDYADEAFQFLYRKSIDKSDVEKWFKIVPEFAKKEPICIYYMIDDTFFLYSEKSNKFVYGDYDIKYVKAESSIYDLCKDDNAKITEKDLDAIKVADIELGYYRITEPEK